MAQLITQCSISLLLYCFVGFFMRYSILDKQKGTNSVVKLHPLYFVIGVVCSFAFNIPAVFLAIREQVEISLVLFSFSMLSISLIFGYLNCRIYYDENGIVVQNFWRKRETIFYHEITDIKVEMDIVLKTEKTEITIRDYMVGRFDFLSFIAPYLKFSKRRKLKSIVEIPRTRKYRDAVYRSSDFIIGLSIYTVVITAFSVFITFYDDSGWICLFLIPATLFFDWLVIYCAKRAHSSKFWATIAKVVYRDGYIK